jgi:tRNA-(ms[2]io[6]A)-hydroxylase
VDTVLANFDRFLQDHADCERKASAMAMSLVAKYPNRTEIIPELIETALEEMEHFRDVYALMEQRGVELPGSMEKDFYIQQLMKLGHGGTPETRFRDRLLLASVIECRGCERFKKVADHIDDPDLSRFYKRLWTSEAKHGNIFVKMACLYFPDQEVYDRLEWLASKEAEIIAALPIRPTLHQAPTNKI